MKFDLTKAKFIPQSNVTTKVASLESLVSVKIKEEIKYDLVFNKAKKNWKIEKNFISQQLDNEGWTASLQDGYVFLVKTNTAQPDEIQPKFLKGNCQPIFTSDYFTLIMGESFDLDEEEGFFLNEEEYEGCIKVYSVKTLGDIVAESYETNQDVIVETFYSLESPLEEEIKSFPTSQVIVTGEGVATEAELF